MEILNGVFGLETLSTVFTEVVSILNSRPLTPIRDDPSDCEPLTSSYFLLQRENLALTPGCFEREDLYSRKQWRRAQFLADCSWKRWIREYIPTLQQRQKWIREKDNLKIGDVVLVVDNSPRGRWLPGRVIKAFPGQDAKVRVTEINTKKSTLTRPVSKLCLLEEAVKSCVYRNLRVSETDSNNSVLIGGHFVLSFVVFTSLNLLNSAKPHRM